MVETLRLCTQVSALHRDFLKYRVERETKIQKPAAQSSRSRVRSTVFLKAVAKSAVVLAKVELHFNFTGE